MQPYHAVVVLLCAAVFISYIDRTNISVGAIAMRLQFGWNETQKGVVLPSFYVGYISLMLARGALANRFGGRLVLGVAVVWWSVFTVLTPVAASISLPLLVTARIALGLGEAAVFPASMNIIGRHVPVLQRSRAVASVTSSLYAGGRIGFAEPVGVAVSRLSHDVRVPSLDPLGRSRRIERLGRSSGPIRPRSERRAGRAEMSAQGTLLVKSQMRYEDGFPLILE